MQLLSVGTGKAGRRGFIASEEPITDDQLLETGGDLVIAPDPQPSEVVDLALQMRDPDGAARQSR